jgi:3'-phosphoadenosine 5'-phosphosulfate sulfotransferase (PAPS reductase)/FAD synthetase
MKQMKNYLSFGGGVNSVAMYLYLLDEGVDFEAVFVDHGTDWPETYEYVDMFIRKGNPITILKPSQKGSKPKKCNHITFDNLYDYSWAIEMPPSRVQRWCTHRFKSLTLSKYHDTPCFVFIGYDWDERHRAKISSRHGQEFRWPLIEAEIDREGCKQIIKDHGLPIPMKSGCYICPFQRVGQLRELRRKHPELFCKLEQLENRNNNSRKKLGLKPYYSFEKPVRQVAEKNIEQVMIWKEDEYPPCECIL